MPDLLAHVLLAYALFGALSWRIEWINAQYVTVGMAGAVIPDLSKADLFIDDSLIEQVLEIPFDWFALHTAGGVLISVLIGTVLVEHDERKRVFGLLSVGAATHLLADSFLRTASGRSFSVLWPLSRYQPPTPGLYLSTEPGPTVIALALALLVYLISRHRTDELATQP